MHTAEVGCSAPASLSGDALEEMPPGFPSRLKLQPVLPPSPETPSHRWVPVWVGQGCCRNSRRDHRCATRMPGNGEWATLMGAWQYVPRKLERGGRSASSVPRRNLLPGNCCTCRKTTGSCGLVSGPQEKKKKKSVVVISAFYHIAPCLWCSRGEKSSFSALGDAAPSVEMGQRCQPCLSTGFEGRQAAHSKVMRRNPSVTGPAQPSACYAHSLHAPGHGLGSGRSRGAGTLLRGYTAAKTFPILWLLQYSMSARAGNHGHRPGTQPFPCSSLDFPVTPEPRWVIATGVVVNQDAKRRE